MQSPSLSAPQNMFLNGLGTKYRAYVGGFGSGKTFVGCLDLLIFASKHPGVTQGYFGPTYPSIRDIFFPTFEEAAHMMGFTVDIKESNKEVHLYRGRVYYGTVICRSMEKPSSIVGFKIARALVDEIDTLPKVKANQAWNKIIARMRLVVDGIENSIGVTTTPEGFLFVYDKFAKNPTESYSMVQASTYENEKFLPPDYIQTLKETYPAALIDAYIDGSFVNLTSGTVYRSYSRGVHRSTETIRIGEPLYIGMDFNVTKQAATVWVKREGGKQWHAVDELVDMYDTPEAIKLIKERYQGHEIYIYPDASGGSRKSVDASISDIALLEQARFKIRANKSNPAVKDRIAATNAAFERGILYVNDYRCPTVAACLEQQVYDNNGAPDKKAGNDHQNDATTYPIAFEFEINKPATVLKVTFSR
jgi:PBSX family phage terminase large subunit